MEENKSLILKTLLTSPIQFLKTLESTSVEAILKSDSPSFALICKQEKGEVISQAILSKLIIDFLDFFNIGKTMSESQIVSTVKLLLEDYSNLKPDDFVLFFNRAKKGIYGKVYDRIDGAVIFGWLEQFMHERDSEIEQIRIIENKSYQKNISGEATQLPDYMIKFRDNLAKRHISEPKKLNQTEQQKIISETLQEFSKIIKEQGRKNYAIVDEITMDRQMFLEYKLLNAKFKKDDPNIIPERKNY